MTVVTTVASTAMISELVKASISDALFQAFGVVFGREAAPDDVALAVVEAEERSAMTIGA